MGGAGLADDAVEFVPLDIDGFDELRFPGVIFRVPAGHDKYKAALLAQFPGEAAAIEKYVRLLTEIDMLQGMMEKKNPVLEKEEEEPKLEEEVQLENGKYYRLTEDLVTKQNYKKYEIHVG